MSSQLTAVALPLVTLASASASAAEWQIDSAHTAAQFAVRHMMVSTVRGAFESVSGTVEIDEADLSKSKIDVVIEAASINTRVGKRDEHLRSADFFDVATFPRLTFKSTKIEKASGGKLKVTGNLTIKNVTKAVTLLVEPLPAAQKNPWGQWVRGITATGTLDRKEFGLTWNKALETGGLLVGDQVELTIDAELNASSLPAASASK